MTTTRVLRQSQGVLLILGTATLVAWPGSAKADDPPRTGVSTPQPLGDVDLRPQFEERGLAVRHQGQRGSCQVFALLGVLEYELSQRDRPVDLSEQYLMWAANEANGFDRTEGFFPEWLIKGLHEHGVCREALMPYVPSNEAISEPSGKAKSSAAHWKRFQLEEIKHWKTNVGYSADHIRLIQESLHHGEPLTATFRWAFGTPDDETYDDDYFYLDRNVRVDVGGHGVIIVGYRLDAAIPGGGYFIIRNSWGAAFADGGHVKVTFDFASKHGMDAYRVSVQNTGEDRGNPERETDRARK